MKKVLIFIILFIICTNIFVFTFAQPLLKFNADSIQLKGDDEDDEIDNNLEEFIENVSTDSEDGDVDYDTQLEKLNFFRKHPIAINRCSFEELEDLELLTPAQINGILNYRERQNSFIAIWELQSVPELDLETCKRIAPYLKAGNLNDFNVPFGELMVKGTHQVFLRYRQVLEKQKGYLSNKPIIDENTHDTTGHTSAYKGGQQHIYARYRYNYSNRISYGVTGEKDAGEEFFKGSNKKGFDFYSAHFYLKDISLFKHIAIGDYEARFGQGLICWTGLGMGKGTYVMNISKQGPALRPYTSVNESNFFRGIGTTIGYKNVELSTILSYKPVDANILAPPDSIDAVLIIDDPNTPEDEGVLIDVNDLNISSIQTAGYHRTEAEIADRNSINIFNAAANIAYKTRKLSFGATTMFTKLDADLLPQQTPANLYRFKGNQLTNASIDYKALVKNFNFFGETAISDNGGIASLNGVLMGLHPKISMSILHRYYSPKYQSLYSSAFGNATRPQNESGLFIGAIVSPIKNWTLTGYADVYRSPWLTSLVEAPSNGVDYLAQLLWKPKRELEMYLLYKNKTYQKNAPDNLTPVDYAVNQHKSSLRYHLQYKITKAVTLKGRAELSWFKNGVGLSQSGYALMQDIIYKPLSSPISISTRFCIFDTPSWDTRIYAYENDVLFSFTVPPYYNKGSRFYAMLRYKLARGIDLWLRYAKTNYVNINKIGTGNEEIDKPHKTEIKAMLRFKF